MFVESLVRIAGFITLIMCGYALNAADCGLAARPAKMTHTHAHALAHRACFCCACRALQERFSPADLAALAAQGEQAPLLMSGLYLRFDAGAMQGAGQ